MSEKDTIQLQSGKQSGLTGGDYTEFVNLAVHDLDSPLRKLSVLTGMLCNKIQPDNDTQAYIDRIQGCVDTMRTLIDDLSVLGSLDDDLSIESCKLETIIRQARRELHPSLAGRDTIYHLPATFPVIEGDPTRLVQLFKNIIANAIKFSEADRGTEVTINVEQLPAGDAQQLSLEPAATWYRIDISDNGIGFPQRQSEKIFEPFVHLHGKSRFPGNGIGLAICRKITERHHGQILAEGRENEGARFTIILPETQPPAPC